MTKSKQINELSITDFDGNPIWEWAIDEEDTEEQDESWVKPSETKKLYRRVKRFNSFRGINY